MIWHTHDRGTRQREQDVIVGVSPAVLRIGYVLVLLLALLVVVRLLAWISWTITTSTQERALEAQLRELDSASQCSPPPPKQ